MRMTERDILSRFRPVLYVQISPERVTLRNVQTGAMLAERPEVLIRTSPKVTVLAFGDNVKWAVREEPDAKVVNPFAHPRTLFSDYTVAELLLKGMVRRMPGRSRLMPSPLIVVHPLGEPAGGYTQIERRVARELAMGAGAGEIIVWEGRALTDQEVLTRQFPAGGRAD